MGRHAGPGERLLLPWDLIGWGAFACLVAGVLVVWLDGSWLGGVLVVVAGVSGLGVVALMAIASGSRTRRRPPT